MPRPPSQNPDSTLEMAMFCFWEHGFEKTSIKNLEQATQLSASSLYNQFQNKKALFISCLTLYQKKIMTPNIEHHLGKPKALEGLRSFLLQSVLFAQQKTSQSCMLAKSLVEIPIEESDIQEVIYSGLELLRSALHQNLSRAQNQGSIRADLNIEIETQILLLFIQGLTCSASIISPQGDLRLIKQACEVQLSRLRYQSDLN